MRAPKKIPGPDSGGGALGAATRNFRSSRPPLDPNCPFGLQADTSTVPHWAGIIRANQPPDEQASVAGLPRSDARDVAGAGAQQLEPMEPEALEVLQVEVLHA